MVFEVMRHREQLFYPSSPHYCHSGANLRLAQGKLRGEESKNIDSSRYPRVTFIKVISFYLIQFAKALSL